MLTFLETYHENRALISGYIDFLENTKLEQHDKIELIKEIARLTVQNDRIKKIFPYYLDQPFETITIEIESKL